MESLVVYGSSRGTTEKVAEVIAESMRSSGVSATSLSVDLVRQVPHRLRAADVLGIGSPVYFLREPRYVTEFVSELGSLEGKKAFVFCTCGFDRAGETLPRLAAMLSDRGAVVVGAREFRAAMSYMPHRKRGIGNPEGLPDESDLSHARDFGRRMAGAMALDRIDLTPASRLTRLRAGLLANRTFRRWWLPGIRVVEKDCTSYGSCLSRCAFRGLERREGDEIPSVTEDCVQCLECLAYCPRSAIVADSRIKEWLTVLVYRLGIH